MIPVILAAALLFQTAHQHHPPQSADEYARVLEDPQRDAWQRPEQVIAALKLRPDEVVADLGAGSGYFTRRFAQQVARVYAVDIDPKLLALARGTAPNIVTVLATPDDPKLPDGSVDTIFICDVLHHIENRADYLPKLGRALKPGGRIVNVDFYKKPLPVGPPESMKLTEDEVIAEFKAAGFGLARRQAFLPYQYFLEFTRERERPPHAARPAVPSR